MRTKPDRAQLRLAIDESTVQPKPRLIEVKTAPVRRRIKTTSELQEAQILALRNRAFNYVLALSTVALISIPVVMLLQGFQLGGFNLSGGSLYSLLAVIVGVVARLLFIIMRSLFRG